MFAEIENNFELYHKALKDVDMKLAYKHLTAILKLKTIYAYMLSTNCNEEKVIAYIETAKLLYALGDLTKGNSFVHKAKMMASCEKAYDELARLSTSHIKLDCPSKIKNLYSQTYHDRIKDISTGSVFLMDQISCHITNAQNVTKDTGKFFAVISDYAVCLTSSEDRDVYYLMRAKKFIQESKMFMKYHGIDVSADFNFMPSESMN